MKQDQNSTTQLSFHESARDVLTTVILVLCAITTGSLILLGEALRGIPLILLGLSRHYDGDMSHSRYDYGFYQLQHMVWVAIGLLFLTVAVWMGLASLAAAAGNVSLPDLRQFVVAAIVNAIATFVNFYSYYRSKTTRTRHASSFERRRRATRRHILGVSLMMQCILTMAVLSQDPAIALWCDLSGAAVLGLLSLIQGMKLLYRGLPGALSARATPLVRKAIRDAIVDRIPTMAVTSIRTRATEEWVEARIICNARTNGSSWEYAALVKDAETELRAGGLNVDLKLWVCREPLNKSAGLR